MAKFDDLIKTVGKFVDVQKGTWDHLEWERLVSKVQRMGYEMSGDIVYNLGTTVEALKKLYLSRTNTDDLNRVVTDIPKSIARFVDETKGMWEHADWLRLLKEIEKFGVTLSEEAKKYIGDMLEASKNLYGAPYKEPAVEVKPPTVKPPAAVEIKRPAAADAERPVEVAVKKPVKSEEKKPFEAEVKKYIAAETTKHVAAAVKKPGPVAAADKTEKKTAAAKTPEPPEHKSGAQTKAKRPYKKRS